mgnify:CR=1 FL=1
MDLMQGVEFSHWAFNKFIENNQVFVDATCGNGNDTIFLADNVSSGGKIYAFDIQKEAIEITKNKFKKSKYNNDIEYINDGHEKIDKYISEKVDGIIYNLGYLPGSEHNIKTEKDTTIKSLEKAVDIIDDNGLIVIVIYTEHEGGELEKEAILDYTTNLDYKTFNVMHYHFINQKKNPPEVVVIKKRRDK